MNDRLDAGAPVDECGLTREELEWRKEFIGFDREDERHLSNLERTFREHCEELADEFSDNLTGHERTREVIDRSGKDIEQLKRTRSACLVTLSSGDYARNRARIGKIHHRLEIPVTRYGVYYDLVFPVLFDRAGDRLVERITDGLATAGGVSAASANAADALEASVGEELDLSLCLGEVLAVSRAMNFDVRDDLHVEIVADAYIHTYSQKDGAEKISAITRERASAFEDVGRVMTDVRRLQERVDEIQEDAAETVASLEAVTRGVDRLEATLEKLRKIVDAVAETSGGIREVSDATDEQAASTEEVAT